jgi:cytosine/adenosine deaminase-related metal-dependent hydrolase
VRVLERIGWAHSVGMERGPVGAHGEPGGDVAGRSAATPADRPFIVHAAEGIDDRAASEIDILDGSGALRSNTVIVHGLAVPAAQWRELFDRRVSLVWCPSSNVFLFGRTLCMPCVLDGREQQGGICLGTDSRVTGTRDLLEELRVAAGCGVDPHRLLRMVTSDAADVLRMDDGGRIRVGAVADLLVIPPAGPTPAEALLQCRRSDVALVVRRGTPRVGDGSMAPAFAARQVHVATLEVDGVRKLAETGLVRRIQRSPIGEAGVIANGSR